MCSGGARNASEFHAADINAAANASGMNLRDAFMFR
jgi:hypothetical protein